MNQTLQLKREMLQDRYGLRLAARLNLGVAQLPYDVSERLRASREQALALRKRTQLAPSGTPTLLGDGTLALDPGGEGLGWMTRLASLLPLLALVVGLVAIKSGLDDLRADELAAVDAALLTDDLPPAAYADTGFLQFLKSEAGQP